MSALSVIRFTNGPWKQNCYILKGHDDMAIIVDPGSEADAITALLDEHGLQPLAIINTHAHFDHIGAISDLVERYSIPFYVHAGDEKLLRSANTYRLLFGSRSTIPIPQGAKWLKDADDALDIGPYTFEVIATPGHTEGGVCFKIDDILFTGDTVLPSGPGRTDLPGGDKVALADSVKRLRALPTHLVAYAGHGTPRTLAEYWSRHDA